MSGELRKTFTTKTPYGGKTKRKKIKKRLKKKRKRKR